LWPHDGEHNGSNDHSDLETRKKWQKGNIKQEKSEMYVMLHI